MPYSISRGCVSKCSFCIYGNIDGGWQCKSVEKVIKDVTFIKEKYKPDLFFFDFQLALKVQSHLRPEDFWEILTSQVDEYLALDPVLFEELQPKLPHHVLLFHIDAVGDVVIEFALGQLDLSENFTFAFLLLALRFIDGS